MYSKIKYIFTTLLLLCVLSPTSYAAEANITGPEKVEGKQFVTLTSSGSKADHQLWFVPVPLQGVTFSCLCDEKPQTKEDNSSIFKGKQITVLLEKTGAYKFILIASDAEGIDYTQHTVTVTKADAPDIGDPPPPPPVTDTKLQEISKQAVIVLGDTVTAKRLKEGLNSIPAQQSLISAKAAVSEKFEEVMLTRGRAEQKYDWFTHWRLPINKELSRINPQTQEQYLSLIKQAALGL